MNPVIVGRLLLPFLEAALQRVAAKHDVPLAPAAAKTVAEAVTNDMKANPAVVKAMTPKPWWQSMGVLSGIGVIVAALASMLGYAVTIVDVSDLVTYSTDTAIAVLGLVAVLGRIRATRSIGK